MPEPQVLPCKENMRRNMRTHVWIEKYIRICDLLKDIQNHINEGKIVDDNAETDQQQPAIDTDNATDILTHSDYVRAFAGICLGKLHNLHSFWAKIYISFDLCLSYDHTDSYKCTLVCAELSCHIDLHTCNQLSSAQTRVN